MRSKVRHLHGFPVASRCLIILKPHRNRRHNAPLTAAAVRVWQRASLFRGTGWSHICGTLGVTMVLLRHGVQWNNRLAASISLGLF